MKIFLKLIFCIISVMASPCHVYANEIASITAIRSATKVTIFDNGSYKKLDYHNNYLGKRDNYLDVMEDMFDLNIGREAILAKKEVILWSDVSNICKNA